MTAAGDSHGLPKAGLGLVPLSRRQGLQRVSSPETVLPGEQGGGRRGGPTWAGLPGAGLGVEAVAGSPQCTGEEILQQSHGGGSPASRGAGVTWDTSRVTWGRGWGRAPAWSAERDGRWAPGHAQ